MNCFSIGFAPYGQGELFSAEKDGVKVLNCNFNGRIIDFQMVYDYKPDTPLHLVAEALPQDKITINIFPHRIELYVNDRLADEEWPCGRHFISPTEMIKGNCNISTSEISRQKAPLPDVVGSFTDAEGWKPEENVFVGDCMPYVDGERYHVLYLKDRHHHGSKWGLGAHQWSHISTKDFKSWDIHPMAVEIDSPDEGSVCTGSWICDGALHHLFYTVRTCDGSPAKIRCSLSADGFHFEKDRAFSFVLSEKYTAESARDPKIVKAGDGMYHMILTTSLKEAGRGCLAHLVSEDLSHWHECEAPLYISPEGMGEPECPDYFYKDGFYYLVYSLKGKGYYEYSKDPFSNWQIPENLLIPCEAVPKAAIWNNRLIFTGFKNTDGRYAGTMTFMEAVVLENGVLSFKKVDFSH